MQTRTYSIQAVIVLAVAVGFGSAATYGFVEWDDDLHFLHNPHLNPVSWDGLRRLWTEPYEKIYTPVPYTVWAALTAVAAKIGGGPAEARLHPHWFHTANVLVHAGNALLVFALLRLFVGASRARRERSLSTDLEDTPVSERHRDQCAAVGALLFALHPIQVETVAWASGMRDLSFAAFGLAALWFHLAPAAARIAANGDTQHRAIRAAAYAVASALLFAIAVFAKPNAVALPFVAVAADRFALGRPWRTCFLGIAPWIPVALVCVFISTNAQPVADVAPTPFHVRPLIAADALAFYLVQFAAPFSFGIDYGRSLHLLSTQRTLLLWGILPVVLAFASWMLRRRVPEFGAGFALFVLALLPVLGFITYRYQLLSTVADRYAYLALIGPAYGVAHLVARASARWNANASVIALVPLVALCALSALQTRTWSGSEPLFRQALRVNPTSVIANSGIGDLLFRAGDFDGAIRRYQIALSVVPSFPRALDKVGSALLAQSLADDAVPYFTVAARSFLELGDAPGAAGAHANLATARIEQGNPDAAIRELERALELDPRRAQTHQRLGALWLAQDEPDRAAAHFRSALVLDPENTEARQGLSRATVLPPTTVPPSGVQHIGPVRPLR